MKLLEGYSTGILFYNDQAVYGNTGLSGIILPKTAFPEGENITNKRAKTKEQAWLKMSSRIQSLTVLGGRHGYKLQRARYDKGSENFKEHGVALDEANIVKTESHRDIHTGCSAIEGMFGRVQTKAAAIGVGALGDQNHLFV